MRGEGTQAPFTGINAQCAILWLLKRRSDCGVQEGKVEVREDGPGGCRRQNTAVLGKTMESGETVEGQIQSTERVV